MRIGLETSASMTDVGGIAQYISQLVKLMPLLAPQHTFHSLSFGHTIKGRLYGQKPLRARMITLLRDLVWAQTILPEQIKWQRLDIMHLMAPVATPMYCPCPLVVTVHDVALFEFPKYFTRWMNWHGRFLWKRAVHSAGAILTLSEFGRQEIVRVLGISPSCVHVVPLGVDESFFRADPSRDEHVCQLYGLTRPFILHVGVLSPRKNIARLVQAFEQLRVETGLSHTLVLAGSRGWGDDAVLKTVMQLDPHGENIRLLGYLPPENLASLYRLAQVFVYPSLYEGFGLPPLEAMASGVPVIASNVASIPEVTGNAALLFDPHRTESLVDALARVLTNRDLSESLRQRGRERAAEFRWERTAHETIKVYERVLTS